MIKPYYWDLYSYVIQKYTVKLGVHSALYFSENSGIFVTSLRNIPGFLKILSIFKFLTILFVKIFHPVWLCVASSGETVW